MYSLVVIRHGQSLWNQENRFTGWTDVGLSEQGRAEAEKAGKLLKAKGFEFDLCYTSYLKRAIHTLDIVLDQMDLSWLPVEKYWRLNERHYGALQGLNKAETAEKHGAEQVHIWRRSYDIQPPALTADDERYPGNDRRYAELTKEQLPLTESLHDTVERMLPFIEKTLFPAIRSGKRIIISAHGNSLRALVKYLDKISDAEIPQVEIPTGVPLIYKLNEKMEPVEKYYLEG